MGVRSGRKEHPLPRLACVRAVAWLCDSRAIDRSFGLLACSYETVWVSATRGWVHPLRCLPVSMRRHGRPLRSEGYALPVHAGIHPYPWIDPWGGMDASVRRMRSPVQPHGCSHPVDARALPTDADRDPGQKMPPPRDGDAQREGRIGPCDGIGAPKPTTHAPMRGEGFTDGGSRMPPCCVLRGPSSTKGTRLSVPSTPLTIFVALMCTES
jgi:hypothetical protein